MRITIDEGVLRKVGMTIQEFLLLLFAYYKGELSKVRQSLVDKGLAGVNVFNNEDIVLSGNTRELVNRILMQCSEELKDCPIDFEDVAEAMMDEYPNGIKSGTTYPWRGTKEEIAHRLRLLYTKFDFPFTKEEAVQATAEYRKSFNDNYMKMKLLKRFIFCTLKVDDNESELVSDFMTYVENLRDLKQQDNGTTENQGGELP